MNFKEHAKKKSVLLVSARDQIPRRNRLCRHLRLKYCTEQGICVTTRVKSLFSYDSKQESTGCNLLLFISLSSIYPDDSVLIVPEISWAGSPIGAPVWGDLGGTGFVAVDFYSCGSGLGSYFTWILLAT